MWRKPTNKDTGKAILVFSEELHDDYNTESIELAVVVNGSGDDFIAICTQWCNYQDHWHTVEITENFLVHDVPTYGENT